MAKEKLTAEQVKEFKVEESEAETQLKYTHQNESAERNSILLFSDVDFLSDKFSVQPRNDNLNLMLNAAEHLSENEAWKDWNKNGQGTYSWTNGEKYVGEWKDGKRNGQGISTRPDGRKYEGKFKDGIEHGRGTRTWKDGGGAVGI